MPKKKKEKEEKKEKKKGFDLNREAKRAIWVIVFLALFLISLLSLISKAGIVGYYINDFSFNLLGQGKFLLPFFFLIISFLLLAKKYRARFSLGLTLLLISFFGFLGFLNLELGYLGSIISYPLDTFGSVYVNLVVIFAIFIISLLILLNISKLKLSIFNFKKKDKIIDEEAEAGAEAEEIEETEIKRQLFWKRKEKIEVKKPGSWKPFDLNLLDSRTSKSVSMGNIENNKKTIEETLKNFGIPVEMGLAQIGPTVTQYSFKPAMGIKLSRITALHNDLALALAAHPIRIEAPIPGKALVGIEVPNHRVSIVRLSPILKTDKFKQRKSNLSLALGRNVAGEPVIADLRAMPHLLVAGSTGSGKTVALNAILLSLLYQNSNKDLNLILIDPKRVELVHYGGIPHLLTPVIIDHKQAVETLNWAMTEMEDRFKKLQEAGVRDIESLKPEDKFPYLVIVIDELADLMSVAAREVESTIVRLAQMARAVGIHLIVSTQRPSVNVITGLIKANITSRIAFQVASQVDSRTILDMAGAEKLLGNGDMLFLSRESAKPRRVQGALIMEKEVKQVVRNLQERKGGEKINLAEKSEIKIKSPPKDIDDDLYEDAKSLVIELERASASLLQRHLRVGYSRAARLLDLLESNGVIGPHQGPKPRKVLIPRESV